MRIILHGCNGRMGQAISQMGLNIVAGVDREKKENRYPTFTKISEVNVEADVVIDFTHVSAVPDLLTYCLDKKLPLVLCTTGLTEELTEQINKASEHIAIFQAYNMSIGINVIARALKQMTKPLHQLGYDIEIVDFHHNKKVDAPSGTAEFLAETVNATLNHSMTLNTNRFDKMQAREAKEIGVHSIRGGTVVGRHNVIFAGENEVIELVHHAESRLIFAKGAVAAAQFLANKTAGKYNMEDVLDEMIG